MTKELGRYESEKWYIIFDEENNPSSYGILEPNVNIASFPSNYRSEIFDIEEEWLVRLAELNITPQEDYV